MITDKFSIKKIPQRIGINNSFLMAIAKTAMMPPNAKLPVSPINTCAGKELYHKKPTHAPTKALIKTTN